MEFEWDPGKAAENEQKHGEPMKNPEADGIREEYEFSGGVRGKYAESFAAGSDVVVLDPDVAAEFNTRQAVNDALREQLNRKPAGDKESG